MPRWREALWELSVFILHFFVCVSCQDKIQDRSIQRWMQQSWGQRDSTAIIIDVFTSPAWLTLNWFCMKKFNVNLYIVHTISSIQTVLRVRVMMRTCCNQNNKQVLDVLKPGQRTLSKQFIVVLIHTCSVVDKQIKSRRRALDIAVYQGWIFSVKHMPELENKKINFTIFTLLSCQYGPR